METMHSLLNNMNSLSAMMCQSLAIVVICIGVFKAFMIYIRDIFTQQKARKAILESRLEIGHSFSLALALLIGASILKTTLAPSWNDIGHLAAVIGIRITLNHFLIKGIEED